MGRPRKRVEASAVEAAAARGLSEYQIAAELGVSADTFAARKQDTPSVSAALSRGRRRAVGEIEAVAFACARQAADDPRYQPTLRLWLRCRAGWREPEEGSDERSETSAAAARERLVVQLARLFGASADGGGDPSSGVEPE